VKIIISKIDYISNKLSIKECNKQINEKYKYFNKLD